MIHLYCNKVEKNKTLCSSCQQLLDYAFARLDKCPYGEAKTACKSCKVHCYKPQMRNKIKTVMCIIGPRMLFYAPLAAWRHFFQVTKSK